MPQIRELGTFALKISSRLSSKLWLILNLSELLLVYTKQMILHESSRILETDVLAQVDPHLGDF
jgi:hypothetical protein